MKINILNKKLNFPKVPNFWKVGVFVLLQTIAFGQQVDTELKAYASLDTNVMLIGDKSTLHLSIELHVGELLGELSYIHSIYIEPEYVEVVEISDWYISTFSKPLA